MTPIDEDAPVVKTIVSVPFDEAQTGGSVEDEVDAGQYVVTVSALGADLPESDGGPLDVHAGALATRWTILALDNGEPSVEVTASMAWDRPLCRVVLGPRPEESPSP